MEKVIALTGVTGAMGGEVLLSLMQSPENFKVRCIIYDAEKKLPAFVKATLKKYKKRIYSFRGSIACREDCEKLLEGADYLINCASLIPPKSDHSPKETYLSNYIGTKNLVDTVLASGNTTAFVHIATVAMYGHRAYPHIWGRVGDPVISSDYDCYSLYKLKAERYLLEAGLNKFVSLRQTAVLHKYMFANNLKDGLMFHTSWDSPLEWVTDRDSGILCKNLIERDLAGGLDGFWNGIYNIGGGESCRYTGFESLDAGFKLMGAGVKKFFKPNWNIPRNFHGVWFYDSDVLEGYLGFRTQSFDDFWAAMAKKYPYFRLARAVPAPIISRLVFKRLFKNTNSPMYWIRHGKEGRIRAFFGGRDKFEEIPTDWSGLRLLSEGEGYAELKNISNAGKYLLNHGYDESKRLEELTLDDLNGAAEFRGGKCAEAHFDGRPHKKIKWQCREGHVFESTPYTVLKGGYWCPHCCEPKPWRYGALAKNIPFYAQVYFDTHDESEVDDVYPLSDDEDKFIENT